MAITGIATAFAVQCQQSLRGVLIALPTTNTDNDGLASIVNGAIFSTTVLWVCSFVAASLYLFLYLRLSDHNASSSSSNTSKVVTLTDVSHRLANGDTSVAHVLQFLEAACVLPAVNRSTVPTTSIVDTIVTECVNGSHTVTTGTVSCANASGGIQNSVFGDDGSAVAIQQVLASVDDMSAMSPAAAAINAKLDEVNWSRADARLQGEVLWRRARYFVSVAKANSTATQGATGAASPVPATQLRQCAEKALAAAEQAVQANSQSCNTHKW
jgi:hypothetical protein